jgi:hypothetical protein
VCILSDGAGIDQYDIGPFTIFRENESFPLQHRANEFAVGLVHLAAEGLNVDVRKGFQDHHATTAQLAC